MAKAKSLEDITIDVHEDPMLSGGKPAALKVQERKTSPQNNDKRKKRVSVAVASGINPKSPVVYVIPEMKLLLKLLKANILIRDGESLSENAILVKALKEYCNKYQKEFYINNKTLFDSL